jgi:hypothetical protein
MERILKDNSKVKYRSKLLVNRYYGMDRITIRHTNEVDLTIAPFISNSN